MSGWINLAMIFRVWVKVASDGLQTRLIGIIHHYCSYRNYSRGKKNNFDKLRNRNRNYL